MSLKDIYQQYTCHNCQVILTVDETELIRVLWLLDHHLRSEHNLKTNSIKELFDNLDP